MDSIDVLKPLNTPCNLSEQVAKVLREKIAAGDFGAGDKLPSETRMAQQLGVSRTVVREAVSRLKSDGLLESRQGSGVFVRAHGAMAPLKLDLGRLDSVRAVMEMVDLRRAIETEAAGLAAERRTLEQVQGMRATLQALNEAVVRGENGVEEDVSFHHQIALATGNPHYIAVLDFLGQLIRKATQITRANEARRTSFARQVRDEHEAIVRAIEAQDALAARKAARAHMVNAAKRIHQADDVFWQDEGGRYVRQLRGEED